MKSCLNRHPQDLVCSNVVLIHHTSNIPHLFAAYPYKQKLVILLGTADSDKIPELIRY